MTEPLKSSLRLQIASTPVHLPIVRAAVDRFAGMLGFDEATCGKITLAVDEALTNIIKHAYHGRDDKPIEITLGTVPAPAGKQALRIELRDWGTPAGREEIKSRDLEDIRPGGLGVHIMNSIMDEVQYAPAGGGGTRLVMTKRM